MSGKHNTKHPDRSRSNYPERLEARGLSKTPEMASLDYLRHHQGTENWLAEHPAIVENLAAFFGDSTE